MLVDICKQAAMLLRKAISLPEQFNDLITQDSFAKMMGAVEVNGIR
tara:strand:- start:101 stop:238 length:138 start_codon:yes stop_codon:yes gene_type:complete